MGEGLIKIIATLTTIAMTTCSIMNVIPKLEKGNERTIVYSEVAESKVWDGSCDTSWYNDSDLVLYINNSSQFAGFRNLVNSGNTMSDQTIELCADIFLNDSSEYLCWNNNVPPNNWEGIETFKGTFNGNNHTIYGLYSTSSGLFSNIEYAVIENLNIVDSMLNVSRSAGMISNNVTGGIIKNCSVSGIISGRTSSTIVVGGICGSNLQGKIVDCVNSCDINVNGTCYAGGISGTAKPVYGSVNSYTANGSLVKINKMLPYEIFNCKNLGNISINGKNSSAGGIVGTSLFVADGAVDNIISQCSNEGNILAENSGGILGFYSYPNYDHYFSVRRVVIESCRNICNISGVNSGGILGYSNSAATTMIPLITNSYNVGTITGTKDFGMFVGYERQITSVENCYYLSSGIQDRHGVSKIENQFSNGEVTLLLNLNKSENIKWYQRLGYDNYPVLKNNGDGIIYAHETSDGIVYTNSETYYVLDRIDISPKDLVISVGNVSDLSVLFSPDSFSSEEMIWASSNPSVVSVNSDGIITALASGTAKITATIGNIAGESSVTVYEINSSNTAPEENNEMSDTVSGIIDNIIVSENPNLDNTDISEEKIEEIKQEIQEAIQNGDTFHTDIKAIQETFDAYKDNWGQIKQAAKDLNAQFAGAYNIEVELCHKDKNDESHHICNITEFEKEVTFTFDLPTGATDKNKRYVLVRIHTNSDGTTEYTPLDVTINGDGTFTAKSNKFSSFILLEVEFDDESTPTEKHNYNNYGYCKDCGNIQNGTDAFVSANAVVGGKIGMNFKVALSAEAAADPEARMIFTMESGKEISIPLSQATLIDAEKNIYQFTLSLTSTQMDEKVTAKMSYSDAIAYPEGKTASVLEDYSVNKYLNNIQTAEETKENPNTRLIELIKAMRNYGAYMDIYSGDTSSDFVPEDLSNRQVSVDNTYSVAIDGEVDRITAKSAAVTVGSLIDITVKFEALSGVDNLVFAVDGVQTQPVLKDGRYCVTIPEISPLNYSKMYTITVTDGQSTMSVKYSALSYVKNKLDDSDQKLVNVCKAMYLYNEAVTQYKDN